MPNQSQDYCIFYGYQQEQNNVCQVLKLLSEKTQDSSPMVHLLTDGIMFHLILNNGCAANHKKRTNTQIQFSEDQKLL